MDPTITVWGYDIKLLEFIVSLVGTLGTAAIAAFAGRIAYLQANGKRPVLILRSQKIDAKQAPPGFLRVTLTHQVWNRRSYAVRVDAYRLAFENAVIRPAPGFEHRLLTSSTHVSAFDNGKIIPPGDMAEFVSEFLMKVGPVEAVKEPYTIRLGLFEPMGWRPKKNLNSREMIHPARQFRISWKATLRKHLSRMWLLGRRIELSDQWVSDAGAGGNNAEVFALWKETFNAQINRAT
jgi:hypothetical protein